MLKSKSHSRAKVTSKLSHTHRPQTKKSHSPKCVLTTTTKRAFRGVYDEPEAIAVMQDVFPESKITRAKRVMDRALKERSDIKRWIKLAEEDPGFNIDYPIEVFTLLNEQFEEKLSKYHYMIYSTSQQSYDSGHSPAQHYFHVKKAQSEVLHECLEYLEENGYNLPWELGEIRILAENMPNEPFCSPIAEVFLAETNKLVNKLTNTIKLNETDEDKILTEKARKLRDLIRDHDTEFFYYAFTIDPLRYKSQSLSLDQTRKLLGRFNDVVNQFNITQHIQQQIKKEVYPLGSFEEDEVLEWQSERMHTILGVLSPYLVKIVTDEFKMKGQESYYFAQHAIHSHFYDKQVCELYTKYIRNLEQFLEPPEDNEATQKAFEKEQKRRQEILAKSGEVPNMEPEDIGFEESEKQQDEQQNPKQSYNPFQKK